MRKAVILLLAFFISYAVPPSEGYGLYKFSNALNGSNFVFKEANVNGWAKIKNASSDLESLKETARFYYQQLTGAGILDGSSVYCRDNSCVIRGSNGNEDVKVEVKVVHSGSRAQDSEQLVTVDITQHKDMQNIIDIRDRLFNLLDKYCSDSRVNVCTIKYIDGKVDCKARQSLLECALSELGAEKVEGISDDNLISLSGYSKSIPWHIMSGCKYININAASRYSSFENRTYFWLGTPVINVEY